MPYESFETQKNVRIKEVVQDEDNKVWLYVVHVERGNSTSQGDEGFSHEYTVSRRYNEFKQLHATLSPVMKEDLTALPSDTLVSLILPHNESMLMNRKQILDQILSDILRHPVARELPEVLDFLGEKSLSSKVLAPVFSSKDFKSKIQGSYCRTVESLRRTSNCPTTILS